MIRVCRRRTRCVSLSVDSTRRDSQKNRGIQLIAGAQVNRAAADVVCRYQPIRAQLPLDAQVPLINAGRFGVEWVRGISAEGGKRHILLDENWKWISARICGPWIRKIDIVQGHSIAKRHRLSVTSQGNKHVAV